ncbi:serine hydrolase domain-containing protein [Streptomyces sp. DSM 44917]|uniref:Serine hydrolase domain-containing protein n=1 Tax=Streptomyces boetiae TaxID=3075541 RepID=A0ABU2LEM9_9ACTN|nr:serine hydrolase domain-containing protein [Streptomyces sp. DSM 44917]MDT0310026.1 serine hydrolase domain-containing protein [Streptomyces sp. DSM 44917]
MALVAGTLLATAAAPANADPAARPTAPDRADRADRADRLDPAALRTTLAAVHEAGIHGTYAAATRGEDRWRGAAGVADTRTGRPVTPGMVHRVGSVTKTFTAVAVLRLAETGRIGLDDPVARHLPALEAQGLDPAVTIRMLLNHTSGIADYDDLLYPTVESVAEYRHRRFAPEELVRIGLSAPPPGAPGERHSYANTNYILAGLLLERVTGTTAEAFITRHVIRPAGLRHTTLPVSAAIPGPNARLYEGLYGLLDPPLDVTVYDPSYVWTAGALLSTMEDLTRFYDALFDGELLTPASLDAMLSTVPIETPDGQVLGAYGLGIYPVGLPCGTFWGHDGRVWGSGTQVFAAPDGERQAAIGVTQQGYQSVDESTGALEPHPADEAIALHLIGALCG